MSFLLAGLVAALSTFFVTPLIIKAAQRFKLIDHPSYRSHPAQTHKGYIPRAGGLALLIGFLVAVVFFVPPHRAVLAIIVAACLTVFIGVLDDRKDISPYIRFIGNIVTALIVVSAGIGVPFITNPLGGVIRLDTLQITLFNTWTLFILADIFAVLWIVWTMNIVGWSSGVDGQMPGFVAITAIILGLLSLRFTAHDISQSIVATLAFITAGAYIGFLPWNYYPQKIMPGYGGKTLAGLLLATIAILSGGKVGSALLLLAIPMVDAAYSLLRRISHKKSPFRPDRNHLHHRLLDLGWDRRSIALFYWTVSLILGIIALHLNSRQKLFIFIMAAVIICGSIYWFSKILSKDTNV